jgi:hypothetical protein
VKLIHSQGGDAPDLLPALVVPDLSDEELAAIRESIGGEREQAG